MTIITSAKRAKTRTSAATPWVIVRTYSAGCFAGRLKSRRGQDVVLTEARRLWYWAGAATLSELGDPTK